MTYYEIPYQAPSAGFGAARPLPLSPKLVPPHQRPRCDYRSPLDGSYDKCLMRYCCSHRMPQNAPVDGRDFAKWIDTCKCPEKKPDHCPGAHTPSVGPFQQAGFGLVPGASSRAPWCSDSTSYIPLQQMLSDLGFYTGPLNGEIPAQGNATHSAIVAWGKAYGVDLSGGITNDVCAAMIDAHNRRGEEPSGGAAQPAFPTSTLKSQMSYRAIRQPVTTKSGAGPSGAAVPAGGGAAGWWASQSTAVKAAVIVGAFAAVGVGAYAITSR